MLVYTIKIRNENIKWFFQMGRFAIVVSQILNPRNIKAEKIMTIFMSIEKTRTVQVDPLFLYLNYSPGDSV